MSSYSLYSYNKQQFNNDVSFNNNTTLATTTITGVSTHSGRAVFTTDVSLNGPTTITGVSTHSGRAIFTDVSVNGLTTITGSTTISGNVGIGITSPNAPLQFSNASVNRKIVLYDTNNNDHVYFGFGINSDMLRYQTATPTSCHAFYTGNALGTGSNELMRILGNGNVGIGITNPNTKLEINAELPNTPFSNPWNSNWALTITNNTANNNLGSGIAYRPALAMGITSGGSGAAGAAKAVAYIASLAPSGTAGWNDLRIDGSNICLGVNNGYVGIGTGSPGVKLEVFGEANPAINIKSSGGAFSYNTSSIVFKNNDYTMASIKALEYGQMHNWKWASHLTFNTQKPDSVLTENMRITADGNVGIGTTAPSTILEVASLGDPVIRVSTLSGYMNNHYTGIEFYSPGFPMAAIRALDKSALTNGQFNGQLSFHTNNNNAFDEKMRIDRNGHVGIGFSDSIDYKLKVNGSIYGTTVNANSGQLTSDKRIKTNIADIDDSHALSILRKIQPKTYDYIDVKERGKYNVIGFIAQEIEEIIPNAISLANKVVPNFYTNCQIAPTDVSNIVLVTSPIDLSWNPLHDQSGNAFVDSDGNACSDASGNKVFKIQLNDLSNNEINCKTTNVLDKRSFLMDVTDSKMVDGSGNLVLENNGEYFLYGQEVDDFHYLDKSYVYTVVTAAVQDIDRKQVLDEAKIAELQVKNDALEAKNAALEARLAALEQAVAAL